MTESPLFTGTIETNGTPDLLELLEQAKTPEACDTLLYTICLERGFTDMELYEIVYANEFMTTVMNGHMRKDKVTPTSIHPKRVATMLAGMGADVFTIKFGLLHDITEDTHEEYKDGVSGWTIREHPVVTYTELSERFGTDIADAVGSVSKVKTRYLRKTDSAADDEHALKEQVEANVPIQTHYKIFESLYDYRIALTKAVDRLDYFLTLIPEIPLENKQRKAIETLTIYAPIADLLRMQFLREELTKRSLALLSNKGMKKLEERTISNYSNASLRQIENQISQVLVQRSGKYKPEVIAFAPSWYRAQKEFGMRLEEMTAESVVTPVVHIVLPFSYLLTDMQNRKRFLISINPWFKFLNNTYRLPHGSLQTLADYLKWGDIAEIPTEVDGKPIILKFITQGHLEHVIRPIVDTNKDMRESAAAEEFKRLHANFIQLKEVWAIEKATSTNVNRRAIVREIIENLQKPLVRVWDKDGKPALFPRGATYFDAACYFGQDIAHRAESFGVTRDGKKITQHIWNIMQEGDRIFATIRRETDNFMPATLQFTRTHQSREMLIANLRKKIKLESDMHESQRPVNNKLVKRGEGKFKGLYNEVRNLNSALGLPKNIKPFFELRAIKRICNQLNYPSYASFMVAMAMDKLTSRKKHVLLHALISRLAAIVQEQKDSQ